MMRFNKELMTLYKNIPLRYKLYTIIRYALCPFFEVERAVPAKGKILDLGCGHGIFANLLAMKSQERHVIGTDLIENKIKVAISTIVERKNVEFKVEDLRHSLTGKDIICITLLDVSCYFPLAEKKALFRRFYEFLPTGGTLIIKSIQEFPRWKYLWTLFHLATIDKLVHKGFKKSSYFLKRKDYFNLLKDIGFKVQFKDINKGYPYPHCLYICTKTI